MFLNEKLVLQRQHVLFDIITVGRGAFFRRLVGFLGIGHNETMRTVSDGSAAKLDRGTAGLPVEKLCKHIE